MNMSPALPEGRWSRNGLNLPRQRLLACAILTVLLATMAPIMVHPADALEATSQAVGNSLSPSISNDGRYVAFQSEAANLVYGDANGFPDIFVRDRIEGTTTLASVSSEGVQGNFQSYAPSISGNGRYVAFESYSSNLVPNDTGTMDIFVRDLVAETTVRVSVASSGSQPNSSSSAASISADGRYIAYQSTASNLVSGDTNGEPDIFLYDRATGTTTRESPLGPSVSPSISADGRFIAFASESALAPGDKNGYGWDIFVKDLSLQTISNISFNVSAINNASSTRPSISGDGRWVAFTSDDKLHAWDDNFGSDVYVRDRSTGTLSLASRNDGPSNGASSNPSIASNGRYVSFSSAAQLLYSDTNAYLDVYEQEISTGGMRMVSESAEHRSANSSSYQPSMSADGTYVAFVSSGWNLVPDDTNFSNDIFVHQYLDPGHTMCNTTRESESDKDPEPGLGPRPIDAPEPGPGPGPFPPPIPPGSGEDDSPLSDYLYKAGPDSLKNFTPRVGIDTDRYPLNGLSTYTSLVLACLNSPTSKKATVISRRAVEAITGLNVTRDPSDPLHYFLTGNTEGLHLEWANTRETATEETQHNLTRSIRSTIAFSNVPCPR